LRIFSTRKIEPELLDHLPPDEARPNLEDLTRINRYFGGHSVILDTLNQVARPADSFSLLDVGAASGDTARLLQAAYPHAHVVNFDYNETNIGAAPRPKVIGNAFRLPFAPRSFDYVMCSLFLHHFQDEEVVGLLRGFNRIARRAVLACDLERSLFPYIFLPATKYFFDWKRVTVHDGMISVRAAFSKSELAALAKEAGLKNCALRVHRPAFRISLVASK